MEHIVQFALGIDDRRIIKEIEKTAERQVIENITKEIKGIIYDRSGWYGNRETNEPLKQMIRGQLDDILAENKETILSEASRILADRLARSKAGKALLEDLKCEENTEKSPSN